MSECPITATQALEWAKEDIQAQRSQHQADEGSNQGLLSAAAILDRWIKRVHDTKPTKPKVAYRDGDHVQVRGRDE